MHGRIGVFLLRAVIFSHQGLVIVSAPGEFVFREKAIEVSRVKDCPKNGIRTSWTLEHAFRVL